MTDMKSDAGKPPMWRLPLQALEQAAFVIEFGDTKKYEIANWLASVDHGADGVRRYTSAAIRHLAKMWPDVDAVDNESGLPHLAHALTSLLFASEIRRRQLARGDVGEQLARVTESLGYDDPPESYVGKVVVRFDGRHVHPGPGWESDAGFGATAGWGAAYRREKDWTVVEVRDGWARCAAYEDLWFPLDAVTEWAE